jgi:hypothetical protein
MDAEYYLWIAAFSYEPTHAKAPGFFPGYPVAVSALARGINAARGQPGVPLYETPEVLLVAAFAVSNLALLFAALALFRLSRLFVDERLAESAAIWLLACPVAFFGSAYLAESLFLLLSIESLTCAFKRRMVLAALLGGAAAFTRPVGILLVVPLFMISLRKRAEGVLIVRDAFLLLLVPAGAAGVVFWQAGALGDPWAYFKVQSSYGHGGFPDVGGILDLFRISGKDTLGLVRDAVQLVALAAATVCFVALVRARRLPAALWSWAAVSIAFVLLSGHLISLPRYLFSVFPLFIGAALLVPPGRWTHSLQAASTVLQVAGFVVFMRAWPVLI